MIVQNPEATNRKKIDSQEADYCDCPECGYRMTKLEVKSLTLDLTCPRCGGTRTSDFRPALKTSEADPGN